MSVANKLSYLGETKEEIREGLNKLGGNISKSDTFRSYADAIEEIYDSMPKVEESDVESATLEGTIKGGLTIDPKGNTSQYTTTGKNLLKNTIATLKARNTSGTWSGNSYSYLGITYEVNDDLTIKVNGTSTGNSVFYITSQNDSYYKNMAGQTLKIVGVPSGGSGSTYRMIFCNNSWTGGIDIGSGNTFEVQDDYYNNSFIQVYNGTTCNNLLFKPMLTTDTSATYNDYEPYTNGASPNPDYPQPINVVSGDNEVVICGKNLAQLRTDIRPYGGTPTTTKIVYDENSNRSSSLISISPNTKYTIYNENDVGISVRRWFYFDREPVFATSDSGEGTLAIGGAYGGAGANLVNTIITPANAKYIFIQWTNNNSTTPCGKVAFYKGEFTSETLPPYEPYQSQTYPINLGVENLYNGTYSSTTEKLGVVATRQDDGSYSLSGTCSSPTPGANADFVLGNCTLEAGTYVISGYPNKTGIRLRYRPTAGDWTGATDVGETGLVITLNQQSTIDLVISVSNGTDTNGTIVYPQIEKGTKKNSFTPYGTTPIELCKIGNYEDKIFKAIKGNEIYDSLTTEEKATLDYGKWYLRKAIGKVVLDGTLGWIRRGSSSNSFIKIQRPFQVGGDICICNKFIYNSSYDVEYEHILVNSQWSENLVAISVDRLTENTLAAAREWLNVNLPIMYYQLATPTTTEITDSTLISQLDNIQNAMSYEGQTSINQTNNDLPFKMDIKAILDWRN